MIYWSIRCFDVCCVDAEGIISNYYLSNAMDVYSVGLIFIAFHANCQPIELYEWKQKTKYCGDRT